MCIYQFLARLQQPFGALLLTPTHWILFRIIHFCSGHCCLGIVSVKGQQVWLQVVCGCILQWTIQGTQVLQMGILLSTIPDSTSSPPPDAGFLLLMSFATRASNGSLTGGNMLTMTRVVASPQVLDNAMSPVTRTTTKPMSRTAKRITNAM